MKRLFTKIHLKIKSVLIIIKPCPGLAIIIKLHGLIFLMLQQLTNQFHKGQNALIKINDTKEILTPMAIDGIQAAKERIKKQTNKTILFSKLIGRLQASQQQT